MCKFSILLFHWESLMYNLISHQILSCTQSRTHFKFKFHSTHRQTIYGKHPSCIFDDNNHLTLYNFLTNHNHIHQDALFHFVSRIGGNKAPCSAFCYHSGLWWGLQLLGTTQLPNTFLWKTDMGIFSWICNKILCLFDPILSAYISNQIDFLHRLFSIHQQLPPIEELNRCHRITTIHVILCNQNLTCSIVCNCWD